MKKTLSFLLCICLFAMMLAGCGGTQSASSQSASYNLGDVAKAVGEAAKISNPLDFTEDDLVYDMSIDMANVEEYTGQRTGTNGAAGAVLALKAKAGAADTVKAQLEQYRANTAAFLANYPEFAAAQKQAEDGRIVVKGDYLLLAIAAEGVDYTTVDEAIDKALQ